MPKDGSGRATVGGRYVFHHMIWSTDKGGGGGTNTPWPVHEVGRNADFFPPEAGRLLKADSSHRHQLGPPPLQRAGHEGASRDRVQVPSEGLRASSEGVAEPRPGQRRGHLDQAEGGRPDAPRVHGAAGAHEDHSFEPHLHAPGKRMCLEAIWGYTIETLSCVGYDHNWVRGYDYADDAAPLLPKGTILHIIGYMDNSPTNKNVPDPRNWQGSGNRSVANMFIDLGQGVALTDEQFGRKWPSGGSQSKERRGHRLPAVQQPFGARRAPANRAVIRRPMMPNGSVRTCGHVGPAVFAALRRPAVAPPAATPSPTRTASPSPAFEGWEKNADGSFSFVFGYMNDNWDEEPDVPVGPDNSFDRRSPTRAADTFPAAAQPLRVQGPRAGGLRRQGDGLDAHDARRRRRRRTRRSSPTTSSTTSSSCRKRARWAPAPAIRRSAPTSRPSSRSTTRRH